MSGVFGIETIDEIDTLLAKIEKEEDMKKVIDCVFGITHANAKVGLKLAKSSDFSKIKGEEDIEMFIEQCTFCSSKEVLQEIAKRLNPELREEHRGFLEYLGLRNF